MTVGVAENNIWIGEEKLSIGQVNGAGIKDVVESWTFIPHTKHDIGEEKQPQIPRLPYFLQHRGSYFWTNMHKIVL